jgi:methyl-accepting chemotaxis protein
MLSKLTVAAKLSLLIGVLVLATLAVGAAAVYGLHQGQQANVASLQIQRDLKDTVNSARAAGTAFRIQSQDFRYLLLRGHEKGDYDRYLASFIKQTEDIGKQFTEVQAVMVRAGLPADGVADARRLHSNVVAQYLEALKLYEPDKPETMRVADERMRGKNRQLDDKIDLIVNTLQLYADSEAARLVDLAAAESKQALMVLGGAVAALVVLAGIMGVLFARSLRRELGGEPAYAKRVASRVAAGDLSSQIRIAPGDTTSLLAAMKRMQDDLRDVVSDVFTGARTVADTSAQIAQGNLDLSQRTESQAGTLEEAASSMEELTATVSGNAENASRATRLATQASGVAGKGGAVVAQVVTTMQGITEASRRISEIIGVIDGIAFQTNILALNAAVEAARAGEQGRGFAVVAAEVRSLAQRSALAAKEIKGLIGASVERVEAGTRLVSAAGSTMAEIVASVNEVSQLITEIAAASREQSSGIAQVNTAVAQMDGAVQQNASLVEEAAAATESMRLQAEALLQAVSRFKLGDEDFGALRESQAFASAELPGNAPALQLGGV